MTLLWVAVPAVFRRGDAGLRALHQPLTDFAPLQLLRSLGARQLRVGPDGDAANLLMILQLGIGLAHHAVDVSALGEHDHGLHAFRGRSGNRRTDHRRVADARQLVEHALDVFREHVQPLGRDDHLLLATADVQLTGLVEAADIAGVEPAVREGGARFLRRVEVLARHVLAPHEDLSVVGDADFDAGDRLAHRAARGAQRVIQRHDRGGLGQTVALDDEEPRTSEEGFQFRIERGGTDDDGPKLEAEEPVRAAIVPPAPGPVEAGRRRLLRFGHSPLEVVAEHLEDLRDADQHGDPPGSNLRDDLLRREAAGEDDRPRQHRRHERRHRLSEHVAQRQEIEEANRLERPRVSSVLRELVLDRDDVRQDVAMGQDDALRFGGRTRREDDLGDVVGRRLRASAFWRPLTPPQPHPSSSRRECRSTARRPFRR